MPFPSVVKFINWITGIPIALEDAMIASLGGFPGLIAPVVKNIDFNVIGDTQFDAALSNTYTRYSINSLRISGASVDISTAQIALYSSSGGGGTVLIAPTAVTVNTASENTNNNTQTILVANTISFNFTSLFVRITTPQGSPATANVIIILIPVS